jgi:hypothetical protein
MIFQNNLVDFTLYLNSIIKFQKFKHQRYECSRINWNISSISKFSLFKSLIFILKINKNSIIKKFYYLKLFCLEIEKFLFYNFESK